MVSRSSDSIVAVRKVFVGGCAMLLTMPAPGQVYRTSQGAPAIYVRTEERGDPPVKEHLFVSARDRVLYTQWCQEMPNEYQLVNDTAGRAEADIAWIAVQALEKEKKLLLDCLKAAMAMLDDRAAAQVRQRYEEGIKTHDVTVR